MLQVLKLLEPTFPGKLIGKEVITKDSKKIGVCSGIIFDLNEKKLYLLISGADYKLRVSVDRLLSIEQDFIIIDFDAPGISSISSNELNKKLELIKAEMILLNKLLSTKLKFATSDYPQDKNYIAKLFHLL